EELKEDEILAVTSSEVKKRRESVEEYKKAEREELAQKEEDEIKVLQKYLPEQLSDAELEEMTKAAITETESSGKKDIGKVMQNLMPKVKGRADGRKINQIAIKLLVDK
ncbi:MAG: GatB/YqeY domain-containing protein, partial [Actinobacteria bacterium]